MFEKFTGTKCHTFAKLKELMETSSLSDFAKTKDPNHNSPLMLLAFHSGSDNQDVRSECIKFAQQLISVYPAIVNTTNSEGIGPLTIAVHMKKPNAEFVDLLVSNGAETNALDIHNKTPASYDHTMILGGPSSAVSPKATLSTADAHCSADNARKIG